MRRRSNDHKFVKVDVSSRLVSHPFPSGAQIAAPALDYLLPSGA